MKVLRSAKELSVLSGHWGAAQGEEECGADEEGGQQGAGRTEH